MIKNIQIKKKIIQSLAILCLLLQIAKAELMFISEHSFNQTDPILWMGTFNASAKIIWTRSEVFVFDLINNVKISTTRRAHGSQVHLYSFAVADDKMSSVAGGGSTICLYQITMPYANASCKLIPARFPQVIRPTLSGIQFGDTVKQICVSKLNGDYFIVDFHTNAMYKSYGQTNYPLLNIIVKMRKEESQKKIYAVSTIGSFGFIQSNSSSINYMKYTDLGSTILRSQLPYYVYDFVKLNDTIVMLQSYILTGVQQIRIFNKNAFTQSWNQVDQLSHPLMIFSYIIRQNALTLIDSNNVLRQISTTTWDNIITVNRTLLNTGQILFTDSEIVNSAIGITYIMTYGSEYYQIWTAREFPACLHLMANCINCQFTKFSAICLECQAGFLLNSGVCQLQNLNTENTSNQNSSVYDQTIVQWNIQTGCDLGFYLNLTSNQCQKIQCQDPLCLQCLYSSKTCNQCKNKSQTILHQNTCKIVEILPLLHQNIQTAAQILSFPSIRLFLIPLQPIFLFLDDYWFYIYHSRNYSMALQIVFDSIQFLNELKITPQFIDFSTIQKQLNVSQVLKKSYIPYTPISFYDQQNKDTQFLINSNQMYTWNYFCGIITFIIFRIIYIIINKCTKSSGGPLSFVKQYFFENSLYKCLFLIFIEGNLIFISFNSSIQLLNPSSFDYNGRFNMITAVIFFFCAIFFSFCFYILVYAFYDKEHAGIFLNYTENTFEGYISQTIQIGLKNLISGFIHAYLIQNYQAQIISLAIVKIVLVLSVLIMRKSYLNKGIFLSFLTYFSTSFILDIILIFDTQSSQEINILNLVELSLISLLGLACLINVLSVTFPSIKQLFKYFKQRCYSNKVMPNQPQEKGKQAFYDKRRSSTKNVDFQKSELTVNQQNANKAGFVFYNQNQLSVQPQEKDLKKFSFLESSYLRNKPYQQSNMIKNSFIQSSFQKNGSMAKDWKKASQSTENNRTGTKKGQTAVSSKNKQKIKKDIQSSFLVKRNGAPQLKIVKMSECSSEQSNQP